MPRVIKISITILGITTAHLFPEKYSKYDVVSTR